MPTMESTQTRIDIADFHTTLYYDQLGSTSSLGIHSPNSYKQLYEEVYQQAKGGYPYQNAAAKKGRIFDRLYSFYRKGEFWQRQVPYGTSQSFAQYAWVESIPLSVSVSPSVSCVPVGQTPLSQVEVSPIPSVLLFPFGWSNWLSLLIRGSHSLAGLSSLVMDIVGKNVFQLKYPGIPAGTPIGIWDLFAQMSLGALDDAFHKDAQVRHTPEFLIIVTVLVRKTGYLSAGNLPSSSHLRPLSNIVCPTGAHLRNTQIRNQIYTIGGRECDFVVWDRLGRFIWFYRLLDSGEKGNYMRLQCYHRNTFQSLILACHQTKLLEEASNRITDLNACELGDLVRNAARKLQTPPHMNAGLRPLLDDVDVRRILAGAKQKFNIP